MIKSSFLVQAHSSFTATLASHLYTKSAMYYWHRNPQCSLPPPTPLCALPCSESDRYMRTHAHTNTYIYVWALVPGGKLQTARPPFLASLRHGIFTRTNCQTKWTMSYKVRSLCVAAFNSPRIDFLIGMSRERREKETLSLTFKSLVQKLDVSPPFLIFNS